MLDINQFRDDKGGNAEEIRESQRRRFPITKNSTKEEVANSDFQLKLVDNVISIDKEWRHRMKYVY
jgi:hypothetical protein